jgi:hypothetical protein
MGNKGTLRLFHSEDELHNDNLESTQRPVIIPTSPPSARLPYEYECVPPTPTPTKQEEGAIGVADKGDDQKTLCGTEDDELLKKP